MFVEKYFNQDAYREAAVNRVSNKMTIRSRVSCR